MYINPSNMTWCALRQTYVIKPLMQRMRTSDVLLGHACTSLRPAIILQ